jgi:hypothetical protein
MQTKLVDMIKSDFRKLTQGPNLTVELSPFEAWCLMATVQLACRHPEFNGPTRQIAEKTARRLQAMVATTPPLQMLAERGWDPNYDEPKGKP